MICDDTFFFYMFYLLGCFTTIPPHDYTRGLMFVVLFWFIKWIVEFYYLLVFHL